MVDVGALPAKNQTSAATMKVAPNATAILVLIVCPPKLGNEVLRQASDTKSAVHANSHRRQSCVRQPPNRQNSYSNSSAHDKCACRVITTSLRGRHRRKERDCTEPAMSLPAGTRWHAYPDAVTEESACLEDMRRHMQFARWSGLFPEISATRIESDCPLHFWRQKSAPEHLRAFHPN